MRRLARFAMYRAVVGYPLFATRVYHAPQFQNFGVDPGFALGGAATADIFLDVSSIILCFQRISVPHTTFFVFLGLRFGDLKFDIIRFEFFLYSTSPVLRFGVLGCVLAAI